MADALLLENVTVDFGGLRALDGVSVVVGDGSLTGLIGPNGAGKTTLFDCASGVLSPSSGRVEVFGRDVTRAPLHQRARLGMARTFQRLELFGSLTVEENIIVALEAAHSAGGLLSEILRRPASIDVRRRAERRASDLLATVGLTEQAQARTADLPMGHARMLEVARALASDPKLLLLDEPSSGLNEAEKDELAALLRAQHEQRGFGMLLVEHDMDFVLGLSQDVYVLDFGKLIARGVPDEIRKDPKVIAAYLGEEIPDVGASVD